MIPDPYVAEILNRGSDPVLVAIESAMTEERQRGIHEGIARQRRRDRHAFLVVVGLLVGGAITYALLRWQPNGRAS